jgi:zinc transporter ZupT
MALTTAGTAERAILMTPSILLVAETSIHIFLLNQHNGIVLFILNDIGSHVFFSLGRIVVINVVIATNVYGQRSFQGSVIVPIDLVQGERRGIVHTLNATANPLFNVPSQICWCFSLHRTMDGLVILCR